uniref:Uncharacterized protein n=1 Tax=Rhizophora mucronata TaxID=61149 RepID=A0A2P2PTY4_RHIMU
MQEISAKTANSFHIKLNYCGMVTNQNEVTSSQKQAASLNPISRQNPQYS